MEIRKNGDRWYNMEHYFKEYIGKQVMIRTTDGKVIEGILKDGIRVIVSSYLLLPSDYVYSVNILDVWYNIYENGIMLVTEKQK